MKKNFTYCVRAFVALGLLISVGIWAYSLAMPKKIDLAPLAAMSKTQRYASLVEALPPRPVPSEGLTFVVLGDTRSNLDIAKGVLARSLDEHPALILHTGDLGTDGTPEEYLAYHLQLVEASEPVPIIPVVGNHEKGPNGDYAPFIAIYGGLRFSFDYGACRFIGILSDEKRGIDEDDWQYLEQELAKPGARHTFVFMHVPPLYVTEAVLPEDGRGFTKKQDEFRELMARMKVDHVFLGHIHGFGSVIINGIPYTVTGGAGASLTERLASDAKVHNFILVRVTPQGVQTEAFVLRANTWSKRTL